MGFRALLIAVTGKDPGTIYEEYSVVPTGRYEEIAESPVCGAEVLSGAYLLHIRDQILPDDRVFGRLSRNASLAACYVNETVMHCFACSWDNGHQRWSAFHDAELGIKHLEIVGDPPSELEMIQDRLFAEQADITDTDYVFDIPIELFVASGGIRYDEEVEGAGPQPWQVLDRRESKKRWWPFRMTRDRT